jgi:hypothetical protein
VKQAIKLLEEVKKSLIGFGLDMEYRMTKTEAGELNRIIGQISDSISLLQAPSWETPEGWVWTENL